MFFKCRCIYLEVFHLTSHRYLEQEASEIAPKCYKSFTYRVPAQARAHLALKTGVMNESEDSEELITLRVSLNMLEGDTGYV